MEKKYGYYTYDGSFYGVLTCIYHIYYDRIEPINICVKDATTIKQHSFLDETINIDSCNEEAIKVYNSISEKISPEALSDVYQAYLSSIEGKELMIYNYIKFGYKVGSNVYAYRYMEEVSNLKKIVKKVTNEVHNFCGFLRFELRNNFYYAAYEPDHNITELLLPHFVNRFADQNFIIHDIKRNVAAIFNTKDYYLTSFTAGELEALNSKTEKDPFEQLWKEYFSNMAIEERINFRQQKRFMPSRYWKHMLETEAMREEHSKNI